MMKLSSILLIILLLTGCASLSSLGGAKHQYINTKDGVIECYSLGKGSPIVLIAGYATDISSWNKPFLAALAKQHEVIVFNNRNVGGSFSESTRYTTKDLAEDTEQLIQQLHLKRPAVLGISMGGMIAQQVGVMYPHRISKLILINTAIAGIHSVKPNQKIQEIILNVPANEIARYNRALKFFFPPEDRSSMMFSVAVDRFQPPYYQRINVASIREEQSRVVLNWSQDNATAKKLESITIPVLILNGLADVVIPPINSDILAEKIPNSQLKRWRRGGHAMIYQYPIGIANTINEFLREN